MSQQRLAYRSSPIPLYRTSRTYRPVGVTSVVFYDDEEYNAWLRSVKQWRSPVKIGKKSNKQLSPLPEAHLHRLVTKALEAGVYVGFAKTRNGSVSVTFIQDDEKERVFLETPEDWDELVTDLDF